MHPERHKNTSRARKAKTPAARELATCLASADHAVAWSDLASSRTAGTQKSRGPFSRTPAYGAAVLAPGISVNKSCKLALAVACPKPHSSVWWHRSKQKESSIAPEELPRRYYDDREDITEEYSFDTLAKGAADGTISRAKAIKLAAMALLGSALALFLPAEEAGANHTRRHRRRQRRRRCFRAGRNCEAVCPGGCAAPALAAAGESATPLTVAVVPPAYLGSYASLRYENRA